MIIGIDPGAKGAIGMLYPDGTGYVEDMPMFGKEVNGAALTEIFEEFRPSHVYFEQVNSFGMGRTSAFTFGQGCGVVKGVLSALLIPYTMVTPQKWKKAYPGLDSDKDKSRMMATRIWPEISTRFKRKKDDGRAEALLIAKWGKDNERV
tara:strand:+ start:252 stop:698 length:447 start_codon:yes stop_codon:yes gene_type:complete